MGETRTDESREKLMADILDREWALFQAAQAGGPAGGPDAPRTFRLMRQVYHFTHPEEVLQSWREDLLAAAAAGRNPVADKQARLDGRLSGPIDPRAEALAAIEVDWMGRLAARYPHTFRGDIANFRQTARAELAGCSERTLELLHRHVQAARDSGRNLVEERYTWLFRLLGDESIAARERREARKG